MNQVADLFDEQAEINRRRSQLIGLIHVIFSRSREVHSLGLAYVDVHMMEGSDAACIHVFPIDTVSCLQSIHVVSWLDACECPQQFERSVFILESVLAFFVGLIESGKPMKAYRPDESQELVA